MNNIPKEVRKAVYDALNGSITYNSNAVPIYTVVPRTTQYPYIEISDILLENDSAQTEEEGRVTVKLEVVSGFFTDDAGFHVCDDIEEQMTDAMSDLDDQVKNEMIECIFVQSSYLKDYDGAQILIRRLLTYEVLTQQV